MLMVYWVLLMMLLRSYSNWCVSCNGERDTTSNAAGNNDPEEGTVSSVAPWILTVAASRIDRRIIGKVVLGNRRTLVGSSVNSFTLNGTSFPLIYGKGASHICPELSAGNCEPDCLDGDVVKGKIVLCDQFVGNVEAHKAGALGPVLNNSDADASFIVPLPATGLSNQEYSVIKSYLKPQKILKPTYYQVKSYKMILHVLLFPSLHVDLIQSCPKLLSQI